MEIILGLEDFKHAWRASMETSKWDAWYTHYYLKYKTVFDNQLKYLYMADINRLKSFVEQLDFERSIAEVERLVRGGIVDKISEQLQNAQAFLDFKKDYAAYLLIGFGHIDGTAFIHHKPYVYFGLEALGNTDLTYLVPHEFNHMVHIEVNRDKFNSAQAHINVGDFVILEGLGTLFPLYLQQEELSDEALRKALMVREDTYKLMQQHQEVYLTEFMQLIDHEMDTSISQNYFIYNPTERVDDHPVKLGYYIGSTIIKALIDRGYSIGELTLMSSEKIIQIYQKE